jgi:hypothetical protein
MVQFGRFNFKLQNWLKHLSFLSTEFDFSDDRWLNFAALIERIASKVRSLERQNLVLDRAISVEPEEDDL